MTLAQISRPRPVVASNPGRAPVRLDDDQLWRSSTLVCAVSLCLSVARPGCAQEHTGPPPELKAIFDNWSRREAAIRSFEVHWTREERRLIPTESVEPDQATDDAAASPRSEICTTSYNLVVDGSRYRYSRSGDQWLRTAKRAAEFEELQVWDGELTFSFFRDPAASFPRGIVDKGPPVYDVLGSDVQALCPKLAFRPLNPALRTTINPSRLTLAKRDEFHEGRRCVVLEQIQRSRGPGKPPQFRYELWIDHSRASLPVRVVAYQNEFRTSDLTIQYRHDDQFAWMPAGWTFRRYGRTPQAPHWTTESVVTALEVNSSIPEETFRLDFPPGSMVGDKTAARSPLFYVIRLDGTRRDLQRDEGSPDYERLIQPGS